MKIFIFYNLKKSLYIAWANFCYELDKQECLGIQLFLILGKHMETCGTRSNHKCVGLARIKNCNKACKRVNQSPND